MKETKTKDFNGSNLSKVYEGHALASPKVARPQYRGMLHAGATIVKADGISGLYAGIVPNIVGGGAAWGLYFLFYNAAKNFIKGEKDGEKSNRLLTTNQLSRQFPLPLFYTFPLLSFQATRTGL